jgi:hypothetical protein
VPKGGIEPPSMDFQSKTLTTKLLRLISPHLITRAAGFEPAFSVLKTKVLTVETTPLYLYRVLSFGGALPIPGLEPGPKMDWILNPMCLPISPNG